VPQYPIRIDLEAARKATTARDAAKMQQAQNTPAAKAILDPAKAVARGNRMQGKEAKESKLINRSGKGYGGYRVP
jgi:hypothetical protein